MTQHASTLIELTHQLFNHEISAEEYRRAVAPTHPHPHGAIVMAEAATGLGISTDELTEAFTAVREVGPCKPDVIGLYGDAAEAMGFDLSPIRPIRPETFEYVERVVNNEIERRG